MDLPRFDTTDDSLMIWHCGTSPFDMANKRGVLLDRHYMSEYSDNPLLKDFGPIVDVVFKPGDMTVFRLTGEADAFYYSTGTFFDDGKKTYNGSRGWVNNLKLYREPVKVLDLMNTIMTRAWAHHFPMGFEGRERVLGGVCRVARPEEGQEGALAGIPVGRARGAPRASANYEKYICVLGILTKKAE